MWTEIRTRLIEILSTLTPVSGTTFTPCDYVPFNRQNYEGFVGYVRAQRDTLQAGGAQDRVTHVSTWVIEVISPEIMTGWNALRETQMCQYADALTALFERYPRLENSAPGVAPRVALSGITKSIAVQGVQFQSPRAWAGSDGTQHYAVSVTLSIEYSRTKAC